MLGTRVRTVGVVGIGIALALTQCDPPQVGDDIRIFRGGSLLWARSTSQDSAWDSSDMTPSRVWASLKTLPPTKRSP